MKISTTCCLLGAAFFLTACSATQKVILDPIHISGNSNNYQETYTKETDILHTKLDIKFNWDSAFVIGKAQIEAKPYFYPLNKVVLKARGFKINRVVLIKKDEEIPLTYSYNEKTLSINLDQSYSRDQTFCLLVDYIAMPAKLQVGKDIPSEDFRGLYFINRDGKEKDKPRQIWTQGETEYNSCWFPTIDGPQEKMTQEISITVPEKMVTLSNGALDFSTDNGDGTRTDVWRQELPHSTYLTMVAAGDFAIVKDQWRDKEVNYYMEPSFTKNARLIFGKTPEMLEFFSKKMDIDYPWDKYSQIVVRDYSGGAMENTSATVFFEGMNLTEGQYLDENYEDIISHELFHHWFGDLVTAESWSNLPLNESFATYGEYLWNEYKYGRDYADFKFMKDKNVYMNSAENAKKKLIRFDYTDREQMFDEVSYQKGGQILHMLRKMVGDEAFFQSLTLYLTRNAYKTAEIHDLRLAFEEITGQDLNGFFNQWFLASGHPVLNIETGYDKATQSAIITIQQQQDLNTTPLYKIPIPVDIYVNGKVNRQEILLEKINQTFTFPVAAEPQLINVDAEKSILAEKVEMKPLEHYTFQYENAPLFMERLEAITKLQSYKKEKSARETLMKALNDKSGYIRKMALSFIPSLNTEEKNQIYGKIKDMALTDELSLVRAAAVTLLKQDFADRDNTSVFEKAAKDKAPSVQKAAI